MRDLSHVQWRTSSHSGTRDNCVQAAGFGRLVGIRDSKAPDAGTLLLTPEQWCALTLQIKGRTA